MPSKRGQAISSEVEQSAQAPSQRAERIDTLDIIRGFAVLGILLANITAFSNPELAYYWPGALPGGGNAGDRAVWLAQYVLVDGKFRGLFTLLFGAGMVLFIDRAGAGRQMRRLALLLIFGLLHFYLLFTGDVLVTYAVGGFVALIAIRWSAPRLLAAGVIGFVAGSLLMVAEFAPSAIVEAQVVAGQALPEGELENREHWAEELAAAKQQGEVMGGDSLPAVVAHRWQNYYLAGMTLIFVLFETGPLILIGMGLFRAGIFTSADARTASRRAARAGVAAGLLLNLAVGSWVWLAGLPPYLTMLAFFGLLPLCNLPLIMGAAVLLSDGAMAIRESWLGQRLALAGKMAFTNYIGTSLVMALIFQGWAGGLFGKMHRLELLVVVAFGWALMLAGSSLWLARYRYGPLEWLWRCLTYGRLFPNRS